MKVSSVKDRKVRALLFAHSFETKIGFGFDLASYLKTKPESALRKHPIKVLVNILKSYSEFTTSFPGMYITG